MTPQSTQLLLGQRSQVRTVFFTLPFEFGEDGMEILPKKKLINIFGGHRVFSISNKFG